VARERRRRRRTGSRGSIDRIYWAPSMPGDDEFEEMCGAGGVLVIAVEFLLERLGLGIFVLDFMWAGIGRMLWSLWHQNEMMY
jgi:hypothetical protein